MDEPESVPRGWRAWAESLGVVAMLAALAIPLLVRSRPPDSWEVLRRVERATARRIGWRQDWTMYAPDPPRVDVVMVLTGVDAEGRRWPLEERDDGSSSTARAARSRLELWRAQAVASIGSNPARVAYLRAVCRRETARGFPMRRVVVDVVRRELRSPLEVGRGALPWSPPERRHATTFVCPRGEHHEAAADAR